jgi:Icc-related predicted phosphoesterase
MKLLLFSDLHASTAAAHKLVERARAVDVVVGAGDFGTMRRNIDAAIEVLRAIERPAVLVAGNNESTDELRAACRAWPRAHVLHGAAATIEGVTFYGLGGGIPVTPFGAWSYDFTEAEADALLAGCPSGCVLVSHSPPQGAVDRSRQGQSLGSTAVRDCILHRRPALVVCGHIHDCSGEQGLVGTSPVVNAGPGGIDWVLETPARNQ